MKTSEPTLIGRANCLSGDHLWTWDRGGKWSEAFETRIISLLCAACGEKQSHLEDTWHETRHLNGEHTEPDLRCARCHGHSRPTLFRQSCEVCVLRFLRLETELPTWIKRLRVWRSLRGHMAL